MNEDEYKATIVRLEQKIKDLNIENHVKQQIINTQEVKLGIYLRERRVLGTMFQHSRPKQDDNPSFGGVVEGKD